MSQGSAGSARSGAGAGAGAALGAGAGSGAGAASGAASGAGAESGEGAGSGGPQARDDAAFRLATFLVTAARDVVDEPAIYGPFRMVDAVHRLMSGVFDDAFLASIGPELESEKQLVMSDRDAFVAWLDELSARFAAEAKRRNLG